MLGDENVHLVQSGYERQGNLPARADLKEVVRSHVRSVCELLKLVDVEAILSFSQLLQMARANGQSVYIMGNGGSAATALHMANDLSTAARSASDGKTLKLHCLNSNLSLFSAIANDFGYERVFVHQLESLLQAGDLVVAISASGNSPNCVEAFEYAKRAGATTIGLLGFDGGRMRDLADYYVHVARSDYYMVEDVHMAVTHLLSLCLRELINGYTSEQVVSDTLRQTQTPLAI